MAHFHHDRSPSQRKNVIKLHEQVDKIGALLSETDMAIFRSVNKYINKPRQNSGEASGGRNIRDGQPYARAIHHQRHSIRAERLIGLPQAMPAPADDSTKITAVVLFVEALVDFDNH